MPILRLLRSVSASGRRGRARLIAALAGSGTAVAALVAMLLTAHTTAAATTTSTATATVQRGTVTQTVSAAGTVQAADTRGLSFSTSGTVTELDVKAGDPVTAGQVLARIDDTDAQTAVDTAQTAVDSAQTALSTAQAAASATPSASTCQAAAGQQGQGQQNGAGSTCTAAGANSATGTNRSGSGGTDSLMSAQQQLNNAELALSQAQQRLAGTVITAPIAGKVLTVNGTLGATETPGSTPFISLAAAGAEVAASFTETDVASLAVGQSATITLPDHGTQTYTGKVSQVSPAGTTANQLVRYSVLIAFDQPPTDLLYGQSANVTVTTQSTAGVLYLPSTAVTGIHDGTGTVTVHSGGTDEARTVQIGLRGDRYTEIRSGLNEGQTVLVSQAG